MCAVDPGAAVVDGQGGRGVLARHAGPLRVGVPADRGVTAGGVVAGAVERGAPMVDGCAGREVLAGKCRGYGRPGSHLGEGGGDQEEGAAPPCAACLAGRTVTGGRLPLSSSQTSR